MRKSVRNSSQSDLPHDRGRGNFRGPCLLSSGPLPVPQLPQHLGERSRRAVRLGMAISALHRSTSSHTASPSHTLPPAPHRTGTPAGMRGPAAWTRSGRGCSAPLYQLHPRMDENAKRSRLRETTAPPQGPSTEEKAAAVSGAPQPVRRHCPQRPRTRASAGPYTPLTRMTRAVAVHTSRVETHTSTIPTSPAGLDSPPLPQRGPWRKSPAPPHW